MLIWGKLPRKSITWPLVSARCGEQVTYEIIPPGLSNSNELAKRFLCSDTNSFKSL
jgi:hypothetical protein